MPSPFPGMDPYLEHPAIFPDLHDRMVTHLSEALQARLPEPYYAALASHTWVEVEERYIDPDVNVLQSNGGPGRGQTSTTEEGGVAVAVAVAATTRTQPVVVRVPHDERRQSYVEVFHPQDGGRLVTVL